LQVMHGLVSGDCGLCVWYLVTVDHVFGIW